jgi:imidazolonepropionase-like amidohydrolase
MNRILYKRSLSILILAFSCSIVCAQEKKVEILDRKVTALVGANVVDVEKGSVISNALVLIEKGRIIYVGPASANKIPQGSSVVKLNGYWLLPGLINSHVHLASALPGVTPATDTDADIVLRMARAAKLSLESGVTTVRIVGAQGGTDFSLKRAINSGYAVGSRIESTGEVIVPTGGHGNREANGVGEFAKATRDQIKKGASWIKISVSGGIADEVGEIGSSPMLPEELKTVIDVAHRNNVKVTAHNGSPEAADEAIALGIDGFEHGYFLKHKQLLEMKQKGIWLVPTICVSQPAALDFYRARNMPAWYLEKVNAVSKEHWEMLKDAIKIGVLIALGTDMDPFEPLGGTTSTIKEAEFYVEAGMSPIDAIRSATNIAAKMLGKDKEIGLIKEGYLADIIAVKENPLLKISALRTISFVIKGGEVIIHDRQ